MPRGRAIIGWRRLGATSRRFPTVPLLLIYERRRAAAKTQGLATGMVLELNCRWPVDERVSRHALQRAIWRWASTRRLLVLWPGLEQCRRGSMLRPAIPMPLGPLSIACQEQHGARLFWRLGECPARCCVNEDNMHAPLRSGCSELKGWAAAEWRFNRLRYPILICAAPVDDASLEIQGKLIHVG